MCGIAGIAGRDGGAAEGRVKAMLDRLVHRGPDDEGIGVSEGATIGARRLAIIDLVHGNQPMPNEDGSVLAVQNGEIYNFLELKADLEQRGHRFTTHNDTEVLPHAYEEFGDDFVERLRGMFAIALWDKKRRRLLLARDRLGKKPLVYAEIPGGVAFASEIQALLTLGLDRGVDETAIAQYLCLGYVPPPRTGFESISSLSPGSFITFEAGRLSEQRRYWRLSYEPKLELSEPEALERLRVEVDEAVRVRLMSDVPLGAFLSGGLDSSAVVAFMAANSSDVRTFSIGFGESDFSELKYARLVAERFGTRHEEFIVEPSALEVLPRLVRHLGNPFADSSVIPTYYVAKVARERVTVALNGDGGDELFAGYDRYRAARVAYAFDAIPGPIRSLAGGLTDLLPQAPWVPRAIRRARRLGAMVRLPKDERYLALVGYFTARDGQFGELVQSRADPIGIFNSAVAEAQPTNDLERTLAIDTLTYLPGDLLVKMDIATMASSLEGRSPFLDHRLVEFVSHLPPRMKFRDGVSKYLLRTLMKGTLPDEILNRPKMGFGVPVGRWMRGPMRSLVEDALLGMPERPLVDRAAVRRLVEDHLSGRSDQTPRVWALLMLELWFRYVVEEGPSGTSAKPPYEVTSSRGRTLA
ncbi:MAG TPA: asparagine synthase (glutamine-hydrolyzing) [Candidatus Limnocylindria bacterium]